MFAGRRPLLAGALAFAAGAAAVLGFSPFDYALAPLFSLTLLLLLWRDVVEPRRAAFLGWLFGAGLFGFGLFWLHHSIHEFGGLGPQFAIPLTLLFAALMALFPALVGWLFCSLPVVGWIRRIWLAPVLWVALEWLRGWLFGGFPWLLLGHSQVGGWLAGYAPLLGTFGISFILLASAGLLASGCDWRRVPGVRWSALLLLLLWVAGVSLRGLAWTEAAGEPLRVAILQPNIPQKVKWRPEQLSPTLRYYRDATLRQPDVDLVVWPETSVPAYLHQVGEPFLRPLGHLLATTHGPEVLLGIVVRPADAGGRYYNSALLLQPDWPRYDKRHLVPFGEYLPWSDWLRPLVDWLRVPMSDFSAGAADQPLLPIGGYSVGVSICYEAAFAGLLRDALPQAHYLVNLSNDAWFGDSLAPHQHLQIARMRALELGRYLLRATNTGISAIIDERGGVVAEAGLLHQSELLGRLQPRTGSTPYATYGDWPILLLSAVILLAGLLFGRSIERSAQLFR